MHLPESGILLEDYFDVFIVVFITSSGILCSVFTLWVFRAVVCGNARREGQKCVLLPAQNSATKYIELHASCYFALIRLNLNKDFAVRNFAVLQNVALFRPWEDALGTLSRLWLCSCLSAVHGDRW